MITLVLDTRLKTALKQCKVDHLIRHLPSLSVADTVQVPQDMETLALKFELVVIISRGDTHIKRRGVLMVPLQ